MRRPTRPRRSGAVTAEAALVLPVFLLLAVGMFDLGMGVFRFNTLSEASRQGCRHAMVHGELAPAGWNGGRWGPAATAIDVPISDSVPAADAVRPYLANCPPSLTRVRVEWPEGNDKVGSQVRVTVTSEYQPILTAVFGPGAIALSSTSTMPIAH
jgi:Flp pilus assembly protein TadG